MSTPTIIKELHQYTVRLAAPETEFDPEFPQLMANRMAVSYLKYGPLADGYPDRIDAIASLHQRLDEYARTGNTEALVDAANFCMIEKMHPRHPDAYFAATDSDGSPGRTRTDGIASADDYEPSGMELTESRGSWEAAFDGLWSGTYASRETAIRGWHRADRRREHERAVAAGMTLLDTAIAGIADKIEGPVTSGYIGNVDPSGRNDHRLWMIWAHGWRRPRGLYPNNPVSVTIGDTAEIAGMTADKAASLAAALAADVRKGLADESIQPRIHGGH